MSLWEGENALRPWEVAWRVFFERSARAEEVLDGLYRRAREAAGPDAAAAELAQLVVDAAAVVAEALAPAQRAEDAAVSAVQALQCQVSAPAAPRRALRPS